MEFFREEIESHDATQGAKEWIAKIEIYGASIEFILVSYISHEKQHKYNIMAHFNLYSLSLKSEYFPIEKYFANQYFVSLEDAFKMYKTLIERIKRKESFEVLLKESLCIQDNISRVISECVICFEDRGDNFCHQCGVSLCSFCLSKIEQNTKLSCPQCRKEYTRCLDDDFNDERV